MSMSDDTPVCHEPLAAAVAPRDAKAAAEPTARYRASRAAAPYRGLAEQAPLLVARTRSSAKPKGAAGAAGSQGDGRSRAEFNMGDHTPEQMVSAPANKGRPL